MEEPDASSLATRGTLLFRLRNWEDSNSWDEFYRLYRRLVYGFARRSGLSHEEAEEVTQDVFTQVAKSIHDFESSPSRGSFRSWLMNLTRWRVVDKVRKRAPGLLSSARTAQSDHTSTIDRIPDPIEGEDQWDQEWKGHLLDIALQRIARRSRPKHIQVFELHVRQRWSVLRVSREMGINPASIYLITHRLTKQLKIEIARLEAILD
jgi:RNA polymerase sigma factor (sigma-70 family)